MSAVAKLIEAGMFNKPEGESAPNRKAAARLRRRVADYVTMVGRHDFKAPLGAYHKPGSMK
jgi:hypothetical protein